MRAQWIVEPDAIENGPLRAVDAPVPQPAPDELLLAVQACGVCRTDLQLAEGDLKARRLPLIPGHQIVGRVEALGSAVDGWEVGERAGAAWLAGACGVCRFCQSARENLCREATFTGWDRHGGYAEFVAVRADFALRVPASFADLEAAPLLCGGVIGYRALRVSGIEPGGRLGLYGFGASAALAIQVAVHWGCEVFAVTRSHRQQERALELGAIWAGSYDEKPPQRLDAAITFAPVGDAVVRALQALERGGTVAINAIHLDRMPQFDYDDLWWERQIRSVANFTRRDAQEFLDLAAQIPIHTMPEPQPLDEANEALHRLKAGENEGAPVLVP